jgi:F-type H+-transporting ATPase subunit alpha
MTQLRSGLSADAESRLKRGEAMTELLTQDKYAPVDMGQQVMMLYALKRGTLDDLSAAQLRQFKKEFGPAVQAWYPELMVELRKTMKLTAAMKQTMDEALKRYLEQLLGSIEKKAIT